jgi:hypothetical protein
MRQNSFNEKCLVPVLPSPYSSDLTLSDFWLFGRIKASFAGRIFNDLDEPLEAVTEFVNEIQPFQLQLVFHY